MSETKIKNTGKSIRGRLLNIARREGIFYQTVLTRYFQERLLYRISQTIYRNNFYLKGGALMYAYERFAARPTLDIDFLGSNISNEESVIVAAFREICSVPCQEDGIMFDTERITAVRITEQRDYNGVRVNIPTRMDTISQVLAMDIGFGDIITPQPVNIDYPLLLDNLPSANILAYSLETVIAEKFHAIVDLADQNSRMKDYYDLYNILLSEQYDVNILQQAIKRTFENRHTAYNPNTMFFRSDFAVNDQMQVRWSAFLKKISKSDEVSFSNVVLYIQSVLRNLWETLHNE